MADKELLKQALERMDRARSILTNDNPRPECKWGMLDTSDLRAAIAQPEQVMQTEPVAWLVYAGVMDMRPVYPAYTTRELAEHAASEIKSVTEIKPLYTTPQPATSAAQSIGLKVC